MKINENWESYGFPYVSESEDLRIIGKINQLHIDQKSDFSLKCSSIDINYDYSGLSGAPVVISGKVCGIILHQVGDMLSAISIAKVQKFFESNDIQIEEEIKIIEVPKEFNEEIRTSTPNFSVTENIDNALKNEGNWFLLYGSPGSGKTLSIASFNSIDENKIICGRYFTKIPNDKKPKELRISPKYFLEWLEELVSFELTGEASPVEERSFEKRIEKLSELFTELAGFYARKNQVAIVIIDGLDEITKLNDFLGIIPIELPSNLKIILSCTSINILPSNIRSVITEDNKVLTTPIDFGQCEAFIAKEIGKEKLSIVSIQELALKSEGHPLYLRYLVNYINALQSVKGKELENWIESIPSIGGDITNYYNSIWENIYSIPNKLWILIILSNLRHPITKEKLIQILPEEYKLSFYSNFQSIEYLIKEKTQLEIYHNSFKDYITEKTVLNNTMAHDYILDFCHSNLSNNYSINNFLYHISLSSNPGKAIVECNQEWADVCALNDVVPELVTADIKRIINLSIDLKKIVDTLRLLFLLQRIEFRYDSVFAENANLMVQSLISLKKYDAALKYLVRDNTLLVDNYDAISFLKILYEKKAFQEANMLLEAIKKRYRKSVSEGLKNKEGIPIDIIITQLNALTLSMNIDFEVGAKNFSNLFGILRSQQDRAFNDGFTELSDSLLGIREYCASWHSAYGLRRFDFFLSSEKIANVNKIKLNNEWAKMRSISAVLFNEMNVYNTGIYEKNENYYNLIDEIVFLIENYGYSKNKSELRTLIEALIYDSKKSEIISKIIKEYFEFNEDFQFREDNGVDLNFKCIHDLIFEFKCRGYLDEKKDFPVILDSPYRYKHWEDFSISILKTLSFIEGKSYKLKAESEFSQLKDVINRYKDIIKNIDFSFNERSYWDRSYYLPESLYPIIYSKITTYFSVFSKEYLKEFVKSIGDYSKIQLGLYSEGFRQCLHEILKILVKIDYNVDEICDLVHIWETHVIDGVQNRWERTPELLKIVEIYGLIDEPEKANEVFIKMLKTSMGPSWYKEDQLDLLNSILNFSIPDKSINKYLKEFAGLLDFASGEMTFQRYVRTAKESFISSLIKQDRTVEALEYFKSEVLPSPELIISNAETSSFDAPEIGNGYILGARNIAEQSGVIDIVERNRLPAITFSTYFPFLYLH